MIISHVKIIAFQISLFCTNYRFSKTVLYIINRKIHGCLEIPDLFLVLNQSRTQSNACARARMALALGKLTTGTPKFRGSGSLSACTIDKR